MKICFILGSGLCAFFPDKWLRQFEKNRVWHLTFWIASISFHLLFSPLELRTVWSSWATLGRLWARLLSSWSPRHLLCYALPYACGSGHGRIHREGEWHGICVPFVLNGGWSPSPWRHEWNPLAPAGLLGLRYLKSVSAGEGKRHNAWKCNEVIGCWIRLECWNLQSLESVTAVCGLHWGWVSVGVLALLTVCSGLFWVLLGYASRPRAVIHNSPFYSQNSSD